MKKSIGIVLILLVTSFTTINCSKDNDSVTPNYDGTWSGSTSQGKSFSFTVSGNKITVINISYALSGNCSPSPTGEQITLFSGNNITGNSFSTSGSTAVSGTFNSANNATGTFSVNFTGNPPGCSSVASGTWTVSK